MTDYSVRGMRIGSASSPLQRATDLAPRRSASFTCPQGHQFEVSLAADAEVPVLWDCRCGRVGVRDGAERPAGRAPRVARSHWDILLERRSRDELEMLLAERLAALHDGVDEMDDAAINLVRPDFVRRERSAQQRSQRSA